MMSELYVTRRMLLLIIIHAKELKELGKLSLISRTIFFPPNTFFQSGNFAESISTSILDFMCDIL